MEGTHFVMHATVPANTNAMIYVPSLPGTQVLESGRPADQTSGLKFKEFKDKYAVFEAESGDYLFESTYQK